MYRHHPCRFAKSSIAKQNRSHRVNVVCDGSPSRIRMVRRISLGITTLPRSSIRLTMPVAFIFNILLCFWIFSCGYIVCKRSQIMRGWFWQYLVIPGICDSLIYRHQEQAFLNLQNLLQFGARYVIMMISSCTQLVLAAHWRKQARFWFFVR